MSDLSHIPDLLADIGVEVQRMKSGHGHVYDVEVTLDDGTVQHSNMSRFLPRRDDHMRKVCRWLAKRPGNRVHHVKVTPVDCPLVGYVYVVVRPVMAVVGRDESVPALLRRQAW